MFSAKKPLSALEHLVLESLWKHAPTTSERLREALAKKHPMKESTTRTILKRLEEKGYVTRSTGFGASLYTPSAPPQKVAASAVRQIIDRFCNGSLEQLLVGMVNNDVVGEDELKRLAQRIARRKKAGGEV